MYPAYSVIFFTTASGAGYGILSLLGMLMFSDDTLVSREAGLAAIATGLVLVGAGLLSSTFHLGRPERAWRAFSQWKSSWLSREGVASVISFVPALALAWFLLTGEAFPGFGPNYVPVISLGMSATAILTVYCTAMIYRSLPTVHQWHNANTVPCYIIFSLMSGAVFINAIMMASGAARLNVTALACLLCLWGLLFKRRYWRYADTTVHASSPESATGLGHLGSVRLFESPHSADNYLLKEMGYKVARKHAAKLRGLTYFLGFWLPFGLSALSGVLVNDIAGVLAACLAVVSLSIGLIMERWLFFAEARHVVNLYYGADNA